MSVFDVPTLRPVTVCGRRLERATHICAFFDSSEQELDCLVPYFSEGLGQGEQVVTIRDPGDCERHVADLRARMPAIDEPLASGQLRVLTFEDTYLRDGRFESESMYRMLQGVVGEDGAGPYKRVRTCGDMTWALRDMPGTDELMEYESRVNQLTAEHDCTLLCVYDVNRFSGRAIMDVIATHPMVIIGDRVYENAYYVEPQRFLQTLLRRGSAPLTREAAAGN